MSSVASARQAAARLKRKPTDSSHHHNAKAGDSTAVYPQGREAGTPCCVPVYPSVPAGYQQQSLLYPFWVPPPYMVPHPAAFWPQQIYPAVTRPWHHSTQPQHPTGMNGTGVFLPSQPSSTDGNQVEQMSCESDAGSSGLPSDCEIDLDSADSTSDCIILEETTATFRHGQIESTTSVELLLPKEWEY